MSLTQNAILCIDAMEKCSKCSSELTVHNFLVALYKACTGLMVTSVLVYSKEIQM
jgi:hypothetical protein